MSTALVAHRDWYAEVPRGTRAPTLFGVAALVVSVAVFGVWGNLAPIAGAIITSGVFVATGQNKIVQHLEGGVIRAIQVHEGDSVQAGQTLVTLDDTSARAELRRLTLRNAQLTAADARLTAELDGFAPVRYPTSLTDSRDPEIVLLLASQNLTFRARKHDQDSQIATLQAGIAGLQQELSGDEAQIGSDKEQLALLDEELSGKRALLTKGYIRKPEVLALQRARANLQGEIGRIEGDIGDTYEKVARTEEQINGVRASANKTAVDELQNTRSEQNDVRERMRAAADVLSRIAITAPVAGIVVKMNYNTPGGVIEPGKSILEIVPGHDELIIEVRVRPQDIENVKVGQTAAVRLTALSRRTTPMITGEVAYLSADALPDDRSSQVTRTDVYVARVRLDASAVASIQGFVPTPGMPAEVYLETTQRTFFQYLLKPLRDTMARAFRET